MFLMTNNYELRTMLNFKDLNKKEPFGNASEICWGQALKNSTLGVSIWEIRHCRESTACSAWLSFCTWFSDVYWKKKNTNTRIEINVCCMRNFKNIPNKSYLPPDKIPFWRLHQKCHKTQFYCKLQMIYYSCNANR